MTLTKDVFFRSHVVELRPREERISTYNEPKWPKFALVIDFETDLDPTSQALVFGFYRVCQLQDDRYVCVEEGLVHADSLDKAQLAIVHDYVRTHTSEVSERYVNHRSVIGRILRKSLDENQR